MKDKEEYQIKRTSWGYILTNGITKMGYFKNKWDIIKFLKEVKKHGLAKDLNVFNIKISF